MKLLRSILISLFFMVIVGSGVIAQSGNLYYSQYYNFETKQWTNIPPNSESVAVQNVEVGSIDVDNTTYNGYEITLPEGNGKDYYYLLEPSSTAQGIVLTSPFDDTDADADANTDENFDLGNLFIVVPNSTLTLKYIHRQKGGFASYVGSILEDNNMNIPINVNFVLGGNNQSVTSVPSSVGTINIQDDLTNLIKDFNSADDLLKEFDEDDVVLNINSGINFNIDNEVSPATTVEGGDEDSDPNAFDLPVSITNYASLSIENLELTNLQSLTNESTGTLNLNNSSLLQIGDGDDLTNNGEININNAGTLNIGTAEANTSSLQNSNTISVENGGTLNCYGTLTNNSNAQLNIAADANVTMYANSTLNNNGTITVVPSES